MLNKLVTVFASINPITAIVISGLTLIAPIHSILYGMLFLIFADCVTGIMAHYYRNDIQFKLFSWKSWKHITSAKLGNTINKALIYMLLIISGFVVDKFLTINEGLYFTKILSGAVALRELKSLVENGSDILGGNLMENIRDFINRNKK